jgi:hypothetical protein
LALQIAEVPHESQRMRRGMIVWLVLVGMTVSSSLLAVYLWHESFWGYLFGTLFAALFAICLWQMSAWTVLRAWTTGFGLVCAISIALAVHWLGEANIPMTAERYTALCNDRSECYPEAGYVVFALVMGAVASFAGVFLLLLGLARGLIWMGHKLTSR